MDRILTAMIGAALLLAACAAPAPTRPTATPTELPTGGLRLGPAAAPATATYSAAELRPPAVIAGEFTTDFTRHAVPYTDIISGGPSKDGIPAIDAPQFITTAEADEWLEAVEPVVLLALNGDVRAYPLQILTWHELVNDTVGGVPVGVTFCPLCNTATAFERTVAGQVLDFGTTGRLRYSNMLMYDRPTESWWQQATGEALVGELMGAQLVMLPAAIVSWHDFQTAHPDGLVLSRETGYTRPYGQNPYAGYDDVNQSPFVYNSWLSSYHGPAVPRALLPMTRVLTVDLAGEAVAYPYELLQQAGAVNDSVGGQALVVLWAAGTASALDTQLIAEGRDVGAAVAYSRVLGEQTLTFTWAEGRLLDQETGSAWDVLGRGLAGPLAGQQLTPVVAFNHFWFSWAAFKPATRIYAAPPP